MRKRFKLLPDDLVKLQKFSKAISPLLSKKTYKKEEKFLQIAISFFQNGTLKELDSEIKEFRLIDFMIALEALFLNNEPELKYKFSNRVAVLVSNNDSEKHKFRDYANKLYKLRSNFVHGSLTKRETDSDLFKLEYGQATGLQCTVREILRLSILYFMSLFDKGHKKTKILKMLDDAIFNRDLENEIKLERKRFKF